MSNEQTESLWQTRARLFLQCGLGALYFSVAAFVVVHLFKGLPDEIPGKAADWIGFWGNMIGGIVGLAGGVIAAVTAIHVLKQQHHKDDALRTETYEGMVEQLVIDFVTYQQACTDEFQEALRCLKAGNVIRAGFLISAAVGVWKPVDASVVAQIAILSPKIALRLRSMESHNTLSVATARKVVTPEDTNSGQQDANARNQTLIRSKTAEVLAKHIAVNFGSMRYYAQGLLDLANRRKFRLPLENEVEQLIGTLATLRNDSLDAAKILDALRAR